MVEVSQRLGHGHAGLVAVKGLMIEHLPRDIEDRRATTYDVRHGLQALLMMGL